MEGLQKHRELLDSPAGSGAPCHPSPSLEAQIANLADEIAYYSHDLDDGLDAGLIQTRQLAKLEVWGDTLEFVKGRFPKIRGRELNAYVIRCLIDRAVEDVIHTSGGLIEASGVRSVAEVRQQKSPLIAYSERLRTANQELRTFLYANLYYHPDVDQMNRRACEMLKDVFKTYLADPKLLGGNAVKRIRTDGLHRTVCDYLSGMTDRYLLNEFARLKPGV